MTRRGVGCGIIDGALFEPAFSLEGVAAYALAIERYIRATGDDRVVEEGILADTLYATAETLTTRRSRDVPLYDTDVLPSGRSGAGAVHVACERGGGVGAGRVAADAR